MAALTVTEGVFGSKGTSCPATLYKIVDYARTVDFKVDPVATAAGSTATNYALIPVPKGFVIEKLAVEQFEKVGVAGGVALTFALKSDSSSVGGTFTLGDTAVIRQCNPAVATAGFMAAASAGSPTTAVSVPGSKFCSAADTLCVCVPGNGGASAGTLSAGKFTVHMIGYQTFGESLSDVAADTPAWAQGQTAAQAADNVSGGDPMFVAP